MIDTKEIIVFITAFAFLCSGIGIILLLRSKQDLREDCCEICSKQEENNYKEYKCEKLPPFWQREAIKNGWKKPIEDK